MPLPHLNLEIINLDLLILNASLHLRFLANSIKIKGSEMSHCCFQKGQHSLKPDWRVESSNILFLYVYRSENGTHLQPTANLKHEKITME